MSTEQMTRALYDTKSELDRLSNNVSGLQQTVWEAVNTQRDLIIAIADLTEAIKAKTPEKPT